MKGMRLRKRAEEILELVRKTEAEFQAPPEGVSGDIYIGRAVKPMSWDVSPRS